MKNDIIFLFLNKGQVIEKISLEKLIYKNYLKTSLFSILFIELVLVIIYFTVNHNLINKSIDFLLNDLQKNAYQLVEEKTKSIDKKIEEIELLAKILQKEHQHFFEYSHHYHKIEKPIFQYAQNGMYYKINNNGGSSVVVSKDTIISKSLKEELIDSEFFDSSFKTLVQHDENIIAVYFNSHKNYNRYYPFLENSYEVYPSDIVMQNYNFYYEADENHNPSKSVVMTDIYLDPAQKGWMLSVIVPIYNQNKLEGVTGIDITLKKFIDNFLNMNLPYNGKTFVINDDGKIIAMTKEIEQILDIKELHNYIYKENEKIEKTINKSDEYNILEYKDKKIVDNFKNIVEDKNYLNKIKINNNNYLLIANKMEKTSWYIISLIEEEDILKDLKNLENGYKMFGYIIIFIIFLFYTIFFFFLQIKAKNFVKQINNPLLKIIEFTKNVGKTKEIKALEPSNIFEINQLNDNFNDLIFELDKRTNHLVIEETKRIYQEKLANTDHLTGAYNRRYLNDFSNDYLKIIKREKKDLSLLIVDLDDFKNINDTFGHDIGDKVLIQLVKIIKKTIRENDLVVRFGGDEFIVLLPNTNVLNTRIVANKIIEEINEYNKKAEYDFSVSIGISYYQVGDNSIEDLISKADKSLYEAKRIGKNCVV